MRNLILCVSLLFAGLGHGADVRPLCLDASPKLSMAVWSLWREPMERMESGVFEAKDTALISALAEFLRRNVESEPAAVALNHTMDSLESAIDVRLNASDKRLLGELQDGRHASDKGDSALVHYALTIAVARLKRLGLWHPEVRIGE